MWKNSKFDSFLECIIGLFVQEDANDAGRAVVLSNKTCSLFVQGGGADTMACLEARGNS